MSNEPKRLIFRELRVLPLEYNHSQVEVVLEVDKRRVNAQLVSKNDEAALWLALVEATLKSVEQGLLRPLKLRAIDAKMLAASGTNGKSVATVLVEVSFGATTMKLPGVCCVGEDAQEALARAALDAINRTIELYLQDL